ncbi:MAG: M23 family metallopeptidase [Actinomycetia bacterium]|nr:M23 family metallopeptidase [Actinomycetes bacterium]
MRHSMRLAVLCLTLASAVAAHDSAGAQEDWPYQWPVFAPVIDPFRAPANPFGAGNRGLEFGTPPGATVHAAASGTILFAGLVAGSRWVTISHPDGVRTSYGVLSELLVSVGQSISKGDPIGQTAGALHVSARIGDAYVDPSILFGGATRVHLTITRHGVAPPGTPRTAQSLGDHTGELLRAVSSFASQRLHSSGGAAMGAAPA